jgi:hypothetical protein
MLRSLSLSVTGLYFRHAERVALQAAAERDAIERKSKCGTAADLDGFDARLQEQIK